jgi:hypothetical protein
MRKHATTQPWWDDVATIKREVFPNRVEAADAEARAIAAEAPLYDVQHPIWGSLGR